MRALHPGSLAVASLFLLGCGTRSSGGSGSTAVAPATSRAVAVSPTPTPAPAPTPVARGDEDVRPLVLIHGITGEPQDWSRVIDGLAHGRAAFRDAYADDLAALAPGSVPRSSVFAVGYYKRRASDPNYLNGLGSIGGCPTPRTDGLAGLYPLHYVDNVDDAVEAILRATGASRVDMVGSSMGGIVARAYVRWRSTRGPGGASRVERLVLLQSPTRGVNDLEAMVECFLAPPFMRWGEIAELARDYPGWQGKSFIHELDDGWDAFCQTHGVEYGALRGTGYLPLDAVILQQIAGYVGALLGGGSSSPAPASRPAPAPSPVPPLGLAPTSTAQTIAQALLFADPARFDPIAQLSESLSDGDGVVRSASSSLAAGPEFPSALFDASFRGTHVYRQPDECIETSIEARELIRRAVLERRLPRAALVSSDVISIAAGGTAGWIRVAYALQGDGLSAQLLTEDPASYLARQGIPYFPIFGNFYGLPTFDGEHRVRLDGDPPGPRVATLRIYDVTGLVAEAGPFFLDVQAGSSGEKTPATAYVGARPSTAAVDIDVASNAAGADFAWRLVSKASPGARSPWSSAGTISLTGLTVGTYELFVWSRHAANAAGELVEEAIPLELGIRVDGSGSVFVNR